MFVGQAEAVEDLEQNLDTYTEALDRLEK